MYNIILLSLVEIIGDFALKQYANLGTLSSLGIGIFGYIGVVFFLIKCLKGSTVLYVNGMWDGISALIETLAAIFILGEKFSDPLQYLGIIMIIVGLFFLKSPEIKEYYYQ